MAQYPPLESIRSVLIANRGEIAVRCIHACKAVGVKSYAIYTQSDNVSLHVRLADESLSLAGDGTAGYTYKFDDILQLCERHGIDAVIPGYGFLSENVEFAKQVTDAGMIFIGPSTESITEMGLKHRAREVAQEAKVPVVPGTDLLASEAQALVAADDLTYPVILKATGGGGGMGLKICHSPEDINGAFSMVKHRGAQLFKNEEVQVFGNGRDVIHFGERECSIQRRHQKVIEECPSPFVEAHPGLRETLTKCAINFASALNYKSAGTVEFLVDDDTAQFFFLEMNTRLQVEHGITELCYGVDIVVLMLRQADLERAGKGGIPSSELLSLQKPAPNGVAIEARIYAEDPFKDFAPSLGVF
uniref:ATP-grasp domain-containing protein n=1 Tax=Bionectria ochroleuca TaxID=29856 RepID=A0A0B7K551_BIOOC